jgi:hypothetical protein
MITKELTIIGKHVTLAYCYGTEINFKLLSNEECSDFITEVVEKIQKDEMPDVQRSIWFILAAMKAYCKYKGYAEPITEQELLDELSPKECGVALGTILGLRAKFYHVPIGEPEDNQQKGGRDDAKND